MSLPEADVAYLSGLSVEHRVEVEANMTCVVLLDWPLPAGFNHRTVDVLVRLPAGYPDVAPDMWWFDPLVLTADGAALPRTNEFESYLGRRWQRWSRHLSGGSVAIRDRRPRELFRSDQDRPAMLGAGSSLMTTTLVLPGSIADDLSDAAALSVESGAVLLARYVETPAGNVRLLGHTLQWVPEAAYGTRTTNELVVGSEGYVPALAAAEKHRSVPVWVHTHPGSSPQPSGRDLVVDAQLSDLFRLRSGSPWYGALVVGRSGDILTFTGHIESEDSRVDIDRVWTTGVRWALVPNWLHAPTPPDAMFDRSIRAFGGAIQSVLAQLRVAVVGCGGTGSSVVEQLVRLGVRRFYLFDPKKLTETNVTRVYGSHPGDVGDPKVQVLAEHIRRIAPDAEVEAVQSSITKQDAAKRLLDADVVFGLQRRQRRTSGSVADRRLLHDAGYRLRSQADKLRRRKHRGDLRAGDRARARCRVPGLPRSHRHAARGSGSDGGERTPPSGSGGLRGSAAGRGASRGRLHDTGRGCRCRRAHRAARPLWARAAAHGAAPPDPRTRSLHQHPATPGGPLLRSRLRQAGTGTHRGVLGADVARLKQARCVVWGAAAAVAQMADRRKRRRGVTRCPTSCPTGESCWSGRHDNRPGRHSTVPAGPDTGSW